MKYKVTALAVAALTTFSSITLFSQETLSQKLEERRATSKADAETKAQMQRAIKELAATNIIETALKQGAIMPDFELPFVSGDKTFTLSEALDEGPVVLVYYRGDWCPYCNLQLAEYQRYLEDFLAAGAQIVAISPQTSENSKYASEENPFDFSIIVDPDNRLARKLGIVFELPDYLQKIYTEFGIDLHIANGSDKMELPLAATYIINSDGEVSYSYLEEDYTKRAEPLEVLAKVKELSSK